MRRDYNGKKSWKRRYHNQHGNPKEQWNRIYSEQKSRCRYSETHQNPVSVPSAPLLHRLCFHYHMVLNLISHSVLSHRFVWSFPASPPCLLSSGSSDKKTELWEYFKLRVINTAWSSQLPLGLWNKEILLNKCSHISEHSC